jgi:hypothetical protein
MGSQSQSTNLDPATQQRIQQAWQAAQQWATSTPLGANPYSTQAAGGYQGYGNAGQVGLGALSGNQADYAALANPYQQNVLDAMQNNWGRLASNVTNSVNDQATQSGAFGGTRHGVAEGVGLSQLAQDQANQMAALQYGGYQSTMNQANQLAGMGLQGNAGMATMGDYLRGLQQQQDPTYHAYDVYNQAIRGLPYGQTTTSTSTEPWGSAILGGALSGAGLASAFGLP